MAAARLDSPARVEEEVADLDLDAEEEELLRQTQGRTLAALERCVTERLHGRTAESTARYWAAVREANRPHGRRHAAPHIVIKRVVGEGGRSVAWIKEDQEAAVADAAQIGEEEDGQEEASARPHTPTDASASWPEICIGICCREGMPDLRRNLKIILFHADRC